MLDQNIGSLCSICRRRDYIPYHCKKCNKEFCDEHYWEKETHGCVEHVNRRQLLEMKQKQYFCGACKCKLFTVNHYYCPDCQQLLCLKHRHKDLHPCTPVKQQQTCSLI